MGFRKKEMVCERNENFSERKYNGILCKQTETHCVGRFTQHNLNALILFLIVLDIHSTSIIWIFPDTHR